MSPYLENLFVPGVTGCLGRDVPNLSRMTDGVDFQRQVLHPACQQGCVHKFRGL